MSDVEVKCSECGAPVTLSEYAAIETISCRKCGAPLRARPAMPNESVRERLRLKKQDPTPEPPEPDTATEEADDSEEDVWRFERYIEQSRQNIKDKPKQTGLLLTWLCFVVLAGVMAYLRYFNGLPPDYLAMLKTYGPYVALGMHVLILLQAFRDTVFQGILCLLVPGYSFFYLFFVSDNFWMRALCAGLLTGIAYDSALYYHEVARHVYNVVSGYIASGG